MVLRTNERGRVRNHHNPIKTGDQTPQKGFGLLPHIHTKPLDVYKRQVLSEADWDESGVVAFGLGLTALV